MTKKPSDLKVSHIFHAAQQGMISPNTKNNIP